MPINKNELTKEMIEKAMQCKSADVSGGGVDICYMQCPLVQEV